MYGTRTRTRSRCTCILRYLTYWVCLVNSLPVAFYFLASSHCNQSHGLPQQSLKDVFHATVESKIQYAAPAWSVTPVSAQRETVSS